MWCYTSVETRLCSCVAQVRVELFVSVLSNPHHVAPLTVNAGGREEESTGTARLSQKKVVVPARTQ